MTLAADGSSSFLGSMKEEGKGNLDYHTILAQCKTVMVLQTLGKSYSIPSII